VSARSRRLVRQVLAWLAGAAVVVIVAIRLPLDAFERAMGSGPHVRLALVDLAIVAVMLATDSIATWLALRVAAIRLDFVRLVAIRGATYVLSLVNYVAGQGGLGVYLHRTGVPGMRAASATLFLVGTTFATLLLLTTGAWALPGADVANAGVWWLLVAGCAAFATYLVVIAIAPPFLARRALFAVLFEAGPRGHGIAIAGRIPHVIVIVLGHWVALRVWGIDVPFLFAAATMPAVVTAAVLPISPAGFGTTQAALVLLFADYAPGATHDDRAAAMLGFAVVHFVYSILAQAAVGLVSLPFANRFTAARSP
jgi:hypothetical protein